MQIQDGNTAKLVGYQMEHGHHGAATELPEGGVVEAPASSNPQPMSVDSVVDEPKTETKAKVVEAPADDKAKPAGLKGAETE